MSQEIVSGNEAILYASNDNGTNWKPFMLASGYSLSTNMSTRNVGTQESGDWEEFVGDVLSWNSTYNGSVGHGVAEAGIIDKFNLLELFISKQPLLLKMGLKGASYKVADDDAGYLKGKAIITDYKEDGNRGDNRSYSVDFQGTGELEVVKPVSA
ncbi:hypothetical protein GCQ56_07725 [Marinifilum sp. N1E240]|uniref:hypothetical protein n=1 Tax=Marinifilum sp. N1E240 TaxID=2608082 RepID=UPI00128D38F4|nr:hypothetical protein [Marinifilum sp. N1E240]MPQ46902.1 hypothetical protein [Marinifilum sp. N1E240]